MYLFVYFFNFYSRDLWYTIPPQYVVLRTALKGKLPTREDCLYFTLPLASIFSFYGNTDLFLTVWYLEISFSIFLKVEVNELVKSCKLRLDNRKLRPFLKSWRRYLWWLFCGSDYFNNWKTFEVGIMERVLEIKGCCTFTKWFYRKGHFISQINTNITLLRPTNIQVWKLKPFRVQTQAV